MAKAKIKTRKWDPSERLTSPKDIAEYLSAVLEEGNPAIITAALGDVARARGMTQLARDTGIGREALYKALSEKGNPEFATILRVIKGLGVKLAVKAA